MPRHSLHLNKCVSILPETDFTKTIRSIPLGISILAFKSINGLHCYTILGQCCDLLRFRFRLWKSFCSGSGSRQYLAQFSNNKKQNLSFQCQKRIISQKVCLLFRLFYFYITFYVGYGSKSGSGTEMHSGSGAGSTTAKSYGSCGFGSGSGSTTLLLVAVPYLVRS
jgi:hypothetical protein